MAKKGPLFAALCSSSVCFWVFTIPARTKKRKKGRARKKNGGNEWAGPPIWRRLREDLFARCQLPIMQSRRKPPENQADEIICPRPFYSPSWRLRNALPRSTAQSARLRKMSFTPLRSELWRQRQRMANPLVSWLRSQYARRSGETSILVPPSFTYRTASNPAHDITNPPSNHRPPIPPPCHL